VYDLEAFANIATAIAEWQVAAQQTPLPELTDMVATCQLDLAKSLDTFNALCLGNPSEDELAIALGAIARRATAAAIFALGIAHRIRLQAQQN
jgi:hypothetical protein